MEYRYHTKDLFTGSSLGNLAAFARLNETADVDGFWSAADNQYYLGEWRVNADVDGEALLPEAAIFRGESQTLRLSGSGVSVEKCFYLPLHDRMLSAGTYSLEMANFSSDPIVLNVVHSLYFPAKRSAKFTKQPLPEDEAKRVNVKARGNVVHITTVGRTAESRVFGSVLTPENVTTDDRTLEVTYKIPLNPNEKRTIPFTFAFSPGGIEEANKIFARANTSGGLIETRKALAEMLDVSQLMTPDPMINRGVQWAKVNTLRVQHQYRAGQGFTNDPPQDIVVIRDLAWYMLGSDYVTPQFSRNLIALAQRWGYHDGGKLTEYFHANEVLPELHDYRLNINDDTPLFVYAIYHHALVCGGKDLLAELFPLMVKACDWILSQRVDGLVRCNSSGVNVWGICGWRNIIDGYNLTGAVTEVNAECYHALSVTAKAAAVLDRTGDAKRYSEAASQLRQAMQEKLVSRNTGLFLLNIGSDGEEHHDITGDEVFPLMFGVADAEMSARIMNRLIQDDFWTPYGARTVAPGEPHFDPDFGYQLVGGVWPNLTAWIAFAVRAASPEKVAEAMVNVYRQSEDELPVRFVNVVPGEFPERLHGTTFESRGMAMSPWMPSTYLWLAIEGLVGVTPGIDGLHVAPSLPATWKWICLKNLPYRSESIDLMLYEGTLYTSSAAVTSSLPVVHGTRLQVSSENPRVTAMAIDTNDGILLFASSAEGGETDVVLKRAAGAKGIDKIRVLLAAQESRMFHLDVEKPEDVA